MSRKFISELMILVAAKHEDAAIFLRNNGALKFRFAELRDISRCESQNPNVFRVSKAL